MLTDLKIAVKYACCRASEHVMLRGGTFLNLKGCSQDAISTAIFFITANVLYEIQYKCSHGKLDNGVFPKWSRTVIAFAKFGESDKPLKHKLGSI